MYLYSFLSHIFLFFHLFLTMKNSDMFEFIRQQHFQHTTDFSLNELYAVDSFTKTQGLPTSSA